MPARSGSGKHVVLTWELGGGFGHLTRLKVLAEPLVERGHRISCIVRDSGRAQVTYGDTDWRWYQAPVRINMQDTGGMPTRGLAEILYNVGYRRPKEVAGRARAWMNLFEDLQPDALISDYSPTGNLAAEALGLPVACVGNGFMVPAPVHPLPHLVPRPRMKDVDSDGMVLEVLNEARAMLGLEPSDQLHRLLRGDVEAIFTDPELDPYQRPAGPPFVGPLTWPSGAEPDWPEGEGPRVFAYLKPGRTANAAIQDLSASGWPVLIYCNELRPEQRQELANATTRFCDGPADLHRVSETGGIVVSHGGGGLVNGLLRKGMPQVVLPLHMEQEMNARGLERTGGGLGVRKPDRPGLVRAAVERVVGEPSFRQAAEAFRDRYADDSLDAAVERFTERFLPLLGDG